MARCREEGVADKDIIVDIVLCFSSVIDLPQWVMSDAEWENAYSYWRRRVEITDYYAYYEDVLRLTRGYPEIDFRHVVAPSVQVPESGFIPIFATKAMLKEEMNIGYADGVRVVNEVRKQRESEQDDSSSMK